MSVANLKSCLDPSSFLWGGHTWTCLQSLLAGLGVAVWDAMDQTWQDEPSPLAFLLCVISLQILSPCFQESETIWNLALRLSYLFLYSLYQ